MLMNHFVIRHAHDTVTLLIVCCHYQSYTSPLNTARPAHHLIELVYYHSHILNLLLHPIAPSSTSSIAISLMPVAIAVTVLRSLLALLRLLPGRRSWRRRAALLLALIVGVQGLEAFTGDTVGGAGFDGGLEKHVRVDDLSTGYW